MLVIHGTWAYGVLSLWAEDSGRPASAGTQSSHPPEPRHPPRPNRTSRAPRPHPFAADPDVLADAVAELAGPSADLARKAIEDELTLRLPSAPDGPLASPELGRAADAADGAAAAVGRQAARAALAAWRVPALTFDPPVAADLLAALGDPGAGSVSAVAGGSVLYLAALARLADDLTGRGRVLPAMAAERRRPLRRQVAARAVRPGRAAGQGTRRRNAAAVPRRRGQRAIGGPGHRRP